MTLSKFRVLIVSMLITSGAAIGISSVVTENTAKADTLQMSSDNGVTGWYPNEPQLTPSAVQGDFGQIFDTPLTGAIYAQPLVVQPTVLVATQADDVYGLNSSTGAKEWSVNVGTPADPEAANPETGFTCGDIGTQMGINGTPVIDQSSDTAYFVAATNSGPNGETQYSMHALNVQTGVAPSSWPAGGVVIQGSADDDPGTIFDGNVETQRAGLIEVHGVVYAAFSSQCDHGNWTGWLVGVSTTTASITTMWASETGIDDPEGGGGGAGIWQSGSAPVVDSQGDIYVATGNGNVPSTPEPGTATSIQNFGEAVVELRPSSTGELQVVDFFIADDATTLNNEDGDLGSGGPVALPASMGTPQEPNVMVEVGKEGILYALNMNALGGYQHGPDDSDAIPWEGGSYGGVWSRPAVWPGNGGYIYYPTSGTIPVKTNGGSLDVFQRMVSASGAVYFQLVGATSNSGNTFGYSSGAPIITSNQSTSGSAVLWIIHANNSSGSGAELQAYDPIPQNPGAAGTLTEIWHSSTFTSTVFSPPGVDNGIVYVGTKTGALLGFGMLPTSVSAMNGDNVDFSPAIISRSETLDAVFTATTSLAVSCVTATGSFSVAACGPNTSVNLLMGQSISVPVTFTPTTIGANTGTLTADVTDRNGSSTATLTLEGDGLAATQVLSAVPGEVDFSPSPIDGAPSSQLVTFTNTSTSAITVTGFTLPAQPFAVTGKPATGAVLEPNGTLSFTVIFTPPGSSGDFVHVFGSDVTLETSAGDFGVPISGSAVPPALINITPFDVDFGDVTVGSTSSMNFQVGDEGGEPLTITVSSPPTTDGFSALTTLDARDVIQPDTADVESVQFAPTTTGPASSTWLIEGNDGSGLQSVTFTGIGIPAPAGGGGGSAPPTTTTTTPTTTTTTTTTTTVSNVPPTIIITSLSGLAGAPLPLKTSGDYSGGTLSFRVRNGTASGCAIVGSSLIARRVGTCIVTALRAASSSVPAISSSETTITMGRKYKINANHPIKITIDFAPSSSSLTSGARLTLQILAADLTPADSVDITGYAYGNTVLAGQRASTVSAFLVKFGATTKQVTSITENSKTCLIVAR